MKGRNLSLVYLLMLWSLAYATSKCLREYTDIPLKRNFYYNGMSLPIILESSERASHLFVNNVLYILFSEVLKIKTIKMIHRDHPTDYINAIERLSNLSEDGVPQSMVNLEVWLPHIFQAESENVIDTGSLGPTGMYGWFVPSVEVEKFWRNFGIIVNHWRSFTNTNVSRLFSSDIHALQTNLNAPSGGTWCDQAYDSCQKGIFVANKSFCRGAHDHNCAILFSSYTEADRGFLVEQIEKYKLRANVAWIGDHLKCFVNKILQSNKPIIFFNWVPNDVTSSSAFELIQFPGHLMPSHSSQDPLSKQYTLKKLVWRVIKTHLPEVFQVISHLHFSKEELEHELSKFPIKWADGIVQQLACDWLKHNPEKWKSWMPLNAANKIPIYLVGFFPKAFPSIKEGARMAVEMLNEDGSVLMDYEVVLQTFTIPCDSDASPHLLRAIHSISKQIMAIIGPTCYEAAEPLVSIASYFNKLVVSFGSDINQRRRSSSDSFFDVMPSTIDIGEIYINVIKFFNCSQLAVIVQDDDNFKKQYLMMSEEAALNNVEIKYEVVLDAEATNQKLLEIIEELKSSPVRIVVLFTGNRLSFNLLCLSLEMEVSNGYAWFIPHGLVSMEHHLHMGGPCSTKEIFQALKGFYVVEPSPFGPPEKRISLGDSTIREWRDLYYKRLDALAMQKNGYGSYAFDAILTFGLALNNLILDDPSSVESINKVETLRKLSSHVRNLHFDGITGSISFKHSQRIGSFDIKQIQENATFQIVGKYDFSKNLSERLSINTSLVLPFHAGLSASQVVASRMCGVESFRVLLNVDCDAAIVLINLACLFLLLASAISCLIIIKRRYDRKVRTTCDRMEELGLFSQDISWLCLDQWEVPRNNVVLNRKLGEGAFGTVFGGEANIGGMWVAAAVKTLKISSKPDEKLDFLSEAEMMKRFSHENIVKLLGVCTRGEPTLAIMEFMLHGDLKTFLLSRRQLVGQSGREADDVSPFQLTKMALDVAHGLLYLSSLNYVHRDLACRNCLVHANKTVKIGDFGMTRPMNDSDYYRFNKRGMFPVRWMAPESLSDGLFGTASDVWSYGVLLYEIITFGSFPYQGLSNRQVLNFVKNGNILSMPADCPPKVESLLKRCWSFDSKNRPRVLEIIEILTELPTLLTPCLDTPSTSVHIDGPWSLEMNLLPRVRHRNQYQKNLVVSDRMSAPASTNNPSLAIQSSRLSSPPFCQHVEGLTIQQDQALKLGLSSCDLGAPDEFKHPDDQGSGTAIHCEMDESFLSQDTMQLCHASINPERKVKEGSLLSVKRSLSADDKTLFDARHWGTISSRICRLYADKIRTKIEEMKKDEKNDSEKSNVKRKTLLPVLSGLGEQEGFATEPRQNNRKSGIGPTQQLTCDSRTDSDYCSQHSKDFSTHIGTALL